MLKLKRIIEKENPEFVREVESPTDGVVLINCRDEYTLQKIAPLHWRAGKWDKPPVDVEIDPSNGKLAGLQIVLQDEKIEKGNVFSEDAKLIIGEPVFVSIWQGEERYIDEKMDVTIRWSTQNNLCIRFDTDQANSIIRCRIDKSLFAVFGDNEKLLGFEICNMSDTEKQTILSAAP